MWFFSKRAPDAPPPSPQQILEASQREADPTSVGAKPDLGRTIYERIRPRLRADIRDLFEVSRGVIGEVRRQTPNAFAVYAPPDGYVIRVYSGLHSLFHQVARVLMTTATIDFPNAPPQEPTRTQEEATEVISRLIAALSSGADLPAPKDEGLTPEKLSRATQLAEAAEDFVICHEFGHITAWLSRGGNPGEIEPTEEYEADMYALGYVVGVGTPWSVQKRLEFARAGIYAGAEFALRVFTSLEHLDYAFETTHPLPGGRLEKLRTNAQRLFGSERRYFEVSRVAFSWDQQLEAMEQRIAGAAQAKRFVLGLTADRVLSTITALVGGLAQASFDPNLATKVLASVIGEITEPLVDEVARRCVALYVTEGPLTANIRNAQMRFREDEVFKALIPFMPAKLRDAIQRHWPAAPT